MSLRKVAAIAAALLTIGAVNLAGAPAHAGDSGPVAASGSEVRQAQVEARRADVARRAGVSADMLDGPWHIVNRHSGKCLAVNWASHDERAWVVQHTCEYSAPYNEEWYFDGAHIVNGHTGKCMAVNWASHDERAWVVQHTCESSAPYNENWNREHLASGYSHFVNQHTGKCLAVNWASHDERAWAVQHTCEYSAPYNEEWLVTY
ncbi:RICIN domain-containing protein [Actinosynnema sp. NPDC050801]|uniref:RICIN domain-containing protein n=1 Tax=unclassified Actinosynnema TaxID=2637065 RepID=UPI0033EDE8A8